MAKPKKISDFTPQRRNANKHTQRGLGMLDNSIAKSGWIGAITAAADGEVFDGSARLETSYTRFGEDVEPIVVESDGTRPVIVKRVDIPNADDPKAVELAIAANRIAQVDLDFDPLVLAEIAEEIDLSQFWHEEELGAMLGAEPEALGEDDEDAVSDSMARADSGQMESRVNPGEIWRCGRHLVGCLDSALPETYDRLLQGKKPDMVWADPPYNCADVMSESFYSGTDSAAMKGLAAANWDKGFDIDAFLSCLSDVRPDNGTVYVCTSHMLAPAIWQWMRDEKAGHESYCVWTKPNPMPSLAKRHWTWATELVCYATWGKHVFNFPESGHALSWWQINKNAANTLHPTQKPVEIVELAFERSSSPSALILDPFLGSGPSLIAAEQMDGDRTVYGCELSPEYCEVILQRWERVSGKEAELTNF